MKKLIIFWILLLCSLVRANVVTIYRDDKPPNGMQLFTVDPNLVAYWVMNENTGTTIADLSGNSNTGTFGAAPNNPSWTTGNFNGPALSFDGTGDYIDCGNKNVFKFDRDNSFSISAWISTTTINNSRIISKIGAASDYQGYQFVINGGKLEFRLYSDYGMNNYIRVITNNLFNDGSWKHIVITYNGSSSASGMHIYVNGIEEEVTIEKDSLTDTIGNNISLKIGQGNSEAYFNGLIDAPMIWNRALDQTEITDLYNKPFKDFPKKIVMVGGKVIMP